MLDYGLLLLRVVVGGFMVVGHGIPKLMNFASMAGAFPDPLGIGSQMSLVGAIAGEFGAGLLLLIGLWTRLAVVPYVFTMLVAAFLVHGAAPFWLPGNELGSKEPAVMYALLAVVLALTGPGRYSFEGLIARRKEQPA